MARSEAARTALLDAAERLFAETGIAQVSDRRIAEVAGNTNHSAVRYYFGGREGLLRALVARHMDALAEPRRAMPEQPDSVLGDVRSLVQPSMAVLAGLPRPSWRARFLAQALHDPTLRVLMREAFESAFVDLPVRASLASRLAYLDPGVVAGRAALIARIVMTATAEVEARAEQDGQDPRWLDVGDFLADAIAGMLAAPVSRAAGTANPLTEAEL